MNRGLKPRPFADHRRYDFHRTFKREIKNALGATGGTVPDFVLTNYTNPNQNAADPYWPREALPMGCTGFAQAHIAEADLKQPVDPAWLYEKTATVSGHDGLQTLEDSFKAATIFGVKLKGETDEQALQHRMAPYFEVRPKLGQDWFDAIVSAVFVNQRPVSLGTTWPPDFENVRGDGIQTFTPSVWVGGHDHCAIGKMTINSVEYLVDISWNGPGWGRSGLSLFTRQQVNAMMKIPGSDSLTSRVLSGEEVKTVWLNMLLQLDILSLVISLLQRLKRLTKPPMDTPLEAPEPVSPPTPTVPPIVPESDPGALLPWDMVGRLSHANWHNVRALADLKGLDKIQSKYGPWTLKEELCATVWAESGFEVHVVHPNYTFNEETGARVLSSTDYGIAQWNDYWHGKEIPPTVANTDPVAAINLMCDYFLAGRQDQWCAHSNGSYKQHIGHKL